MKTQKLIKQAEELLGECIKAESASDDIIMKDVAFEEAAHLAVFARNHMQEIIDKLKRYEEALVKLRDCDWVITLPDRMDGVRAIARQALGEE